MKTYNEKCPLCGAMNYNILFEETNGWMQCSCCAMLTRSVNYIDSVRIRPAAADEFQRAVSA